MIRESKIVFYLVEKVRYICRLSLHVFIKVKARGKLNALFAGNWKPGVSHLLTVTEMLQSNMSKSMKCSASFHWGFYELCVTYPPSR